MQKNCEVLNWFPIKDKTNSILIRNEEIESDLNNTVDILLSALTKENARDIIVASYAAGYKKGISR